MTVSVTATLRENGSTVGVDFNRLPAGMLDLLQAEPITSHAAETAPNDSDDFIPLILNGVRVTALETVPFAVTIEILGARGRYVPIGEDYDPDEDIGALVYTFTHPDGRVYTIDIEVTGGDLGRIGDFGASNLSISGLLDFVDSWNSVGFSEGEPVIAEYTGTDGNDFQSGQVGPDVMSGGEGSDTLLGGGYSDTISGGRAFDSLAGGAGDDLINGNSGGDLIFGEGDNDFLRGNFNGDYLEGGDGNDTIAGNRHDDTLIGGAGNDLLRGGGNDDSLEGGIGADTLLGGRGDDFLFGGLGADTFKFKPGFGQDTIFDFNPDEDVLLISHALGENPFAIDALLDNATDEIALDGSTGVLIDLGSGDTLFLQDITVAQLEAASAAYF